MTINFSDYDLTEFIIKEGDFCGIPAKLIIPNHIGCKFDCNNRIFRSSIWDLQGNLLSASFKKFTNLGENPEHFPPPQSLDNTNILCKIDGSTCIFDYVNDTLSMRTRGVLDYRTQTNFKDFEICLEKYPKIIDWIKSNNNYSLICEIVTPNCQVILKYEDWPDLYLIGAINKNDYSLAKQSTLDVIAQQILIKRPKYYQFPSIDELVKNISEDKFIEGVCIYSSNDQEIHKSKAAKYLSLHRLKSELSSFDKIIDLYLVLNRPDYKTFYDYIVTTFDFELARQVEDNLKKVCDLGEKAQKTLDEIRIFVSNLANLSRKEAALKIIETYKEKQLDSFAFTLLTQKPIDIKIWKKLMENLYEI